LEWPDPEPENAGGNHLSAPIKRPLIKDAKTPGKEDHGDILINVTKPITIKGE
jgi:hypothetical protein